MDTESERRLLQLRIELEDMSIPGLDIDSIMKKARRARAKLLKEKGAMFVRGVDQESDRCKTILAFGAVANCRDEAWYLALKTEITAQDAIARLSTLHTSLQ